MVPRWTNPPERNTEEWIRAFRTNPRLAVVERIASDLSFAEGKLFRVDRNGDEQEVTTHPFLDFWANPNPLHEMSNAAMWRLLEIYLKLKGEGYFVIERARETGGALACAYSLGADDTISGLPILHGTAHQWAADGGACGRYVRDEGP